MENKIVQVTPTEEYFSINWQLGIRCNYDCMYCSPKWHDNTSQHHSLEKMQQAWLSVYKKTQHLNLPYKISFVGGELTTNKYFLPFVTWLRENYNDQLFKLMVTTNGSATVKYYSKMFEAIDNIAFSVHTEHINEKKFFDMIIELKNNIDSSRFIQVAIMDEFWNGDRIPLYKELLDRHGISYTVNRIDYSYQTRTIPIFQGHLNLEV
jgi:MoaA/NifB/PqqE/SkfB family radical SAM enzyme